MAAAPISIEDKKFLAQLLYAHQQLPNKVIAQRVKVSEHAIGRWVKEGNWERLRSRMLIRKEEQINFLYEQLEELNKVVRERKEQKHANNKEADIIIKITAAIRNLETDLAIAEIVESGIRFIKHVQQVGSSEQVLEISDLWNSFILSAIKK